MEALNREDAFSFFVCGLAWVSIAAGMALLRRGSRMPSRWLMACFALQGIAAWTGAMIAYEAAAASGRLRHASGGLGHWGLGHWGVLEIVRLAMLIGSLVALVEYGQRNLARHRAKLPGRWIYALLAAWTAFGLLMLERGWLEFGLSVLLAWPGVIVSGLFLLALTKQQRLARRGSLVIAMGTLLAAAIAGCLPLGAAQPALALLAAAALWRVFARRAKAKPAPAWRRAAAPTAFVLALVAGWFAIVSHRSSQPDVIPPGQQDIASLIDQLEDEPAPQEDSKLDRQLERCGLAMAPILALVLAVWGLSRLPFVR